MIRVLYSIIRVRMMYDTVSYVKCQMEYCATLALIALSPGRFAAYGCSATVACAMAGTGIGTTATAVGRPDSGAVAPSFADATVGPCPPFRIVETNSSTAEQNPDIPSSMHIVDTMLSECAAP